jgi:hypothetical protein
MIAHDPSPPGRANHPQTCRIAGNFAAYVCGFAWCASDAGPILAMWWLGWPSTVSTRIVSVKGEE